MERYEWNELVIAQRQLREKVEALGSNVGLLQRQLSYCGQAAVICSLPVAYFSLLEADSFDAGSASWSLFADNADLLSACDAQQQATLSAQSCLLYLTIAVLLVVGVSALSTLWQRDQLQREYTRCQDLFDTQAERMKELSNKGERPPSPC
jgi:hypothetical protein